MVHIIRLVFIYQILNAKYNHFQTLISIAQIVNINTLIVGKVVKVTCVIHMNWYNSLLVISTFVSLYKHVVNGVI